MEVKMTSSHVRLKESCYLFRSCCQTFNFPRSFPSFSQGVSDPRCFFPRGIRSPVLLWEAAMVQCLNVIKFWNEINVIAIIRWSKIPRTFYSLAQYRNNPAGDGGKSYAKKPFTFSHTYLNSPVTTVIIAVEASFSHNDAIFKRELASIQPARHVSQASMMRNATINHPCVWTGLESVPAWREGAVGVPASAVGLVSIGFT